MQKFASWVFIIFSASYTYAEQDCSQTSVNTTPTSQFEVNFNGTILDKKTNLLWQKCLAGETFNEVTQNCDGDATTNNWQAALQHPASLNTSGGFAGFTDWRLPNIKELGSIVEYGCHGPAINLNIFPDNQIYKVWSSTSHDGTNQYTWFVDFTDGKINSIWRTANQAIRLVRNID